MHEPCYLVLADGTTFRGKAFGKTAPLAEDLIPGSEPDKAVGEIVFNTGMCGYHEILTDPSYTGQIVTMTYPLIGNYGVDDSWSEVGPETPGRSKVKAAGFVVRKLYHGPLPEGRYHLSELLDKSGTPGIEDIDTRAVTLKLRDEGSSNGVIVRPKNGSDLAPEELESCRSFLSGFPDMEGRNLIANVGISDTTEYSTGAKATFAVMDCGIKANIARELEKRNIHVVLYGSNASTTEILSSNPDAVLFANGPGDPAVLEHIVQTIKPLIGLIPVLGICLGHQLICRAIGAETRKMKFGHHGVNHPVRDELTGRVFVTSQNHGFDIDESTLDSNTRVWFRNANDQTIEGIRDDSKKILTAQFHPEAAPGPHDSSWIFDEFVNAINDKEQ